MGWNDGYTIIESQVVNLYDLGILTKEVLKIIMEPFRDTDVDYGGSCDLKAKDGKKLGAIICFIMEPERYKAATENFVPDPEEPDYNEELHDMCDEITKREWNLLC